MERKLLISNLTLGYEGLFDLPDFLKLIEDWFKQNGYEKAEKRHVERVGEKGKYLDLELMPYKDINDYTRYEIYVRIRINNLTETKIKKNGHEFRMNKGNISMLMDVFLATDIRNRYESKPFYFFLRTIFNKFIGKEYISAFEKGLMQDAKNFHSEIKSYLNLERYKEMA